jgi:hypothetical protein
LPGQGADFGISWKKFPEKALRARQNDTANQEKTDISPTDVGIP